MWYIENEEKFVIQNGFWCTTSVIIAGLNKGQPQTVWSVKLVNEDKLLTSLKGQLTPETGKMEYGLCCKRPVDDPHP